MAIFEIEDASGKIYEVDAPDMMTAAKAFNGYTPPTVGGDIAKSGGIGLAQGAIGMAGMIPDIAGLMKSAANEYLIDPLLNATIGPPSKTLTPEQQPPDVNKMFGSQNIKKQIEGVTGEFYKPQTTAGEYARTIGEFAPNLAGGPGGIGRKLLTNVAAPAVSSEAAGQAAREYLGAEYEPYARIAGGVAGGVGAAKANTMLADRAAQARVPTADKLLEKGSNQFDSVRNSGETIDGGDLAIISQGIKSQLVKDGFHPDSQGPVFNALNRLETLGASGVPVPMSEIEVIRKNLVKSKMNPDGSIREAAKQAVDDFMQYQTMALPSAVSGELKDAIGNWAAGKRSNTVMGKALLAEQNAGGAGAGANIDNTSRQAIKQLTRPVHNDIVPVAKKLGFNDAEIAAMNKIVGGTGVGNAARLVGKAAPTGSVSTATAAYTGNAMGGPVGAVALPVVGYIAKKIGDLSTKQQIKALDSLVRSRSPHAVQVAASLPQVAAQLPPKSAALLNSLTSLQSAQPTMQVKQPAY